MSSQKSMTVQTYIHSSHKRAEASALLDSGATENFINLQYTKWLKLPIKTLEVPRPLFNVDGTQNRQGDLKYYTDLTVRTGQAHTQMRFFLSDLGNHQLILGYPWFALKQPKINWARGWIDESHLPIVIAAPNAHLAIFTARTTKKRKSSSKEEITYVARVSFLPEDNADPDKDLLSKILLPYQRYAQVFSEVAAQRFPEPRIWDHAIELKPGALAALPRKIYSLTAQEQDELKKFVKEHLQKGYIHLSKSPYAAPFFFIKKKDGKL